MADVTPNWQAVFDGMFWEKVMNTREEQFMEDERDLQAQQQVDHEAQQERVTDILRRLAEGVPLTKPQVVDLCIACGIDKRQVF